jgi:deazaflavin-dependent oxidoreductase (nitroreductase family)
MRTKLQLIRTFSRIHKVIYQLSNGRIASRFGKFQFLLLITTGRKSGKQRIVPLVAIPHGANYLIIASFGGSHYHPDWFLNIKQAPAVQVQIGSVWEKTRARIVERDHPDYEAMWAKAVATYKGFDGYRKLTSRLIPIVVLFSE